MKKLISVLLVLVMLLSMAPTNLILASAATNEFAGGSGTQSDPYLIETKYHLDNVRNHLDAHFKMIADIEFTDADFAEGGEFYNDGAGFSPIGTIKTLSTVFSGTFDGDGHSIINLHQSVREDVPVGLFGYNAGNIKYLNIVGGSVLASATTSGSSADVGSVVGYNIDGTIENCSNSRNVCASFGSPRAGGIVGYIYKGTVTSCYNSGLVVADSDDCYTFAYSGGIAGDNWEGRLSNCQNTGCVFSYSSGTSLAGGIVADNSKEVLASYNCGTICAYILGEGGLSYANAGGIAGQNSESIQNCYNTGKVTVYAYTSSSAYICAGGITGYNDDLIENCYNIAEICAYAECFSGGVDSGGIAGSNSSATITNCYNIGSVTASAESFDAEIYIGGIVGDHWLSEVTNCYYVDTIPTGAGNNTGIATKCSLNDLKQRSTFVGFDFTDVWTIDGSNCYLYYPELKDNMSTHIYDNDCDDTCNCGYQRAITHKYYIGYDEDGHFDLCDICGKIENKESHDFSSDCDTFCDCGYVRTAMVPHNYQPSYDYFHHYNECSACGNFKNIESHSFVNACDTTCVCGYVRTITHSYGKYVYNNDATTKKDGTKTRTCKVCGNKQTVTATGTKLQSANPFKDVKKSDFYYTPVLWAVQQGITSGTSKTTFAPNKACTRGQIATFLWRAAGCPTPKTSKNPFTDVKKSDYYYKAVLWAVGQGITSGTSKTTFSPNDPCTRGQIAAFLWRANGTPNPKTSKNPFTDVKKSDYYYKAVLWAVGEGITSGTSKTKFSPNDSCTRGQIATFLYRNYN